MRTHAIAIVATAAILLASCGKSEPGQTADSAGSGSTTPAMAAPDPVEALEGYAEKYSKDAGVKSCLTQSVHSCVSSAVNSEARTKSDLRVCDELSEASFRNSCKSMVGLSIASETGNSKVCAQIEDEQSRRECVIQAYMASARKGSDPAKCNGISAALPAPKTASGSNANLRADAWTQQSLTASIGRCKSMVISESAKSPEACSVIEDEGSKEMCELTVRMRINAPAPTMPPR